MRIVMVDNSRGWGGAEEQMLALACGLERRGHVVCVVARRDSLPEERFRGGGCRVSPVSRKGLGALCDPFRLAMQARNGRFDLVHVHRDHDLPLGKLLSLAAGAPLLLTQHCMPKRPSAMVYSMADRIVAVSHYIADGIRTRIPSIAKRLSVIHNGIDPALFADPDRGFWRVHPQVGDRFPLIGAVGAFYKGQEELIAMLPLLREEFPRIMLILLGEDPAGKQQLVELAEKTGVADAVVFAGRIPRERMKDALAGLDLNVSAFRNEGFGLSVIEGFAVGTPFVGYRSGGYPEIVSACGGGVLADTGGELLTAIADGLRDPDWRLRIGREAGESVGRTFPLRDMIDRYEALYAETAGSGSR